MATIEQAREAVGKMLDAQDRRGLAGIVRAGQKDDLDAVQVALLASATSLSNFKPTPAAPLQRPEPSQTVATVPNIAGTSEDTILA